MISHTNLPQSQILAEFLPLESADMCWCNNSIKGVNYTDEFSANLYTVKEMKDAFDTALNGWDKYWELIPCWSLAALLEHLRRIDMFPDIIDSVDCVMMDISFADDEDGKVLHPIHCLRVEGKTILDACVEMILKLHELKLI